MSALTARGPLDQAAVTGKPNGLYNAKSLIGGVDGNQVHNKLWPAGDFNNKEGGPLSAIQHADAKMKGMSQNLSTNQALMTSYINIPRLVVPVILPGIASDHDIQLRKCLGSGDVVFHLRYNNVMLAGGHATRITRKYMPDLVYCINLPSLNYILIGIQHVLSRILFANPNPPAIPGGPELFRGNVYSQDNIYMRYKALKNSTSTHNSLLTTRRWIHFLDLITHNDMDKLMRMSLWEGICKTKLRQHENPVMRLEDMDISNDVLHKTVSYFLWDFINTYAKTAGIFVGSDEQGGNHYGQANPCVQAPSDFVGVIQVAGKNMAVRNMWSSCGSGTSSGDMLGFKLQTRQVLTAIVTDTISKEQASGNIPLDFELSPNGNTPTPVRIPVANFIQMKMRAPSVTTNLGGNDGVGADNHGDGPEIVYNYTQYSLLVPCKRTEVLDTSRDQYTNVHSNDDNGFLQFGMCDQISKPCNVSNMDFKIALNAASATVPMPFQMYMRMGFMRIPRTSTYIMPLHQQLTNNTSKSKTRPYNVGGVAGKPTSIQKPPRHSNPQVADLPEPDVPTTQSRKRRSSAEQSPTARLSTQGEALPDPPLSHASFGMDMGPHLESVADSTDRPPSYITTALVGLSDTNSSLPAGTDDPGKKKTRRHVKTIPLPTSMDEDNLSGPPASDQSML